VGKSTGADIRTMNRSLESFGAHTVISTLSQKARETSAHVSAASRAKRNIGDTHPKHGAITAHGIAFPSTQVGRDEAMIEYKYTCAKCGTQTATILFKKYQGFVKGKKVICRKCKSEAYFNILDKLKKKWEENHEHRKESKRT
jgi:hypothetical protein